MAIRETRPLVVYDAKDGGVTANKKNIRWICDNTDRPFLQTLRAQVEAKGEYKYSRIIKSSDIGITSESLRFNPICGGDFISTINRLTNRYVLKYNRKNKHLCCLGKLNPTSRQRLCDPIWKFDSAECDDTARKWCADNPKDPVCGCFLDSKEYDLTLGPPECVDQRCAGNPKAYKTQSMIKRNCPDIVNCNIENVQFSGENIDISQLAQNCGKTEAEVRKQLDAIRNQRTGSGNDNVIQGVNDWTLGLGIGGLILVGVGGYMLIQNRNKT